MSACTDLFGRHGWRWRVIRTTNAYVFLDPASGFGNRTGTLDQEIPISKSAAAVDPDSPLERALAAIRCRDRRKIAREGERWDLSAHAD